MPASSKRARRVKLRERDSKHTGKPMRKAKKKVLDTKNETEAVARDLGNRKKFHPQDTCNLQCKNPRQEEFIQMWWSQTDAMFVKGPAGTSKTFLTLYCALNEVFDESSGYDKVVIVRSAVESSRPIGHLPGEIDLKLEPYEDPYRGTVEEILPSFRDAYEHCKALGYIEFRSTSFLRGITLHRTIVVVDEAQNMDLKELKTITERVSKTSKIVILGDTKQDDLSRQKGGKSGLDEYEQKFDLMPKFMPEIKIGKIEYLPEDNLREGVSKAFSLVDYYTS